MPALVSEFAFRHEVGGIDQVGADGFGRTDVRVTVRTVDGATS